jgi:hypothetical protein
VIAALGVAQEPLPVPIPADLSRDAYQLYSSIYRNATRCDTVEPDELIAISRWALRVGDGDQLNLMSPRSAEERGMIRNLVQLGKTPYVWESRFEFGRPYRILADQEHDVLSQCQNLAMDGRPSDAKCSPYERVVYERWFSLPSFNKDRTRALVYTSRSCGWFLCGGAEFREYRRTKAGWQRVDTGFAGTACAIY